MYVRGPMHVRTYVCLEGMRHTVKKPPVICLEGLGKTMKNLSQNSRYPSRYLEHKPEALVLEAVCWVLSTLRTDESAE
jgi:hypothetical protein